MLIDGQLNWGNDVEKPAGEKEPTPLLSGGRRVVNKERMRPNHCCCFMSPSVLCYVRDTKYIMPVNNLCQSYLRKFSSGTSGKRNLRERERERERERGDRLTTAVKTEMVKFKLKVLSL